MTKIISFYRRHFERKKQRPLTPQMVTSLLAACAKQKAEIPFGHNDIKGSFMALIKRGLIIKKEEVANEQNAVTWQVTAEAIEMLKAMQIEVPF